MYNLIRPTIYLNAIPWYNPKSILTHLENPAEVLIDLEKSRKVFKKNAREIYYPILSFIFENKIETNLILTADFIIQSKNNHKPTFDIIKGLIESNLVVITAACSAGESFSLLYNMEWWSKRVIATVDTLKEYLSIKPEYLYISQIYRSLEIERVLLLTGINNFIVRQKGSKLLPFSLKLSELRRYHGKTVSWINKENDSLCNFIALPDARFFEPNSIIFMPNREEQVRKMSMEIGLDSSVNKLKKIPSRVPKKLPLRLADQPSLFLFNDLEKSTLRMWEYMSMLIMSRLNSNKVDPFWCQTFETYSRMQNKDFFYYLNKGSYYPEARHNFTSPYEAFATMQTAVKKLEIIMQG